MDIQIKWLVISAVALVCSALCSGIEIAFVTSDRVRVSLDVQRGGLMGRLLGLFYRHSEFFISTILVGNNIALVVYGMGAAQLLEPWLEGLCPSPIFVLAAQTLISTVIILFTAEFIPKTVFRVNPNLSLRLSALPAGAMYAVLYPVSWFATALSRGLMSLFGVKTAGAKLGALSVGDLNDYIEQTLEAQTPEQKPVEAEVKIFHNALDFSTTHLRECMVPRNEIVAVDIDETSRDDLQHLFVSTGRSKILVYRGDIDNLLGYIHVSELFREDADWHKRLKPVVYAPETLMANKMMRRLLGEKRSIAVIVDEFGGTAGMVTLEDLVEEICGDIQDEHDRQTLTEREVEPGVWEFSGRTEIGYLNDKYHFDIPEDAGDGDYQTLAGYILQSTGSLPAQGETLELDGLSLQIAARTASRLELIRLRRAKEEEKD